MEAMVRDDQQEKKGSKTNSLAADVTAGRNSSGGTLTFRVCCPPDWSGRAAISRRDLLMGSCGCGRPSSRQVVDDLFLAFIYGSDDGFTKYQKIYRQFVSGSRSIRLILPPSIEILDSFTSDLKPDKLRVILSVD